MRLEAILLAALLASDGYDTKALTQYWRKRTLVAIRALLITG